MTPQLPDLIRLEREISRAHTIVAAVMIGVVAAYGVWFWLVHSRPVSSAPDSWGQFGDFVGGLLNPLVAYAAFYWLTRSVRLQKEELHETRLALAEASRAQTDQAEHARTSVRLNALSTLTNSIATEVELQRIQLQFLVEQISASPGQGGAYLLNGTFLGTVPLTAHIATLNARISERMTERFHLEQEIHGLLKRYP
jgi:hypothetical protein